MDWSSLALSFGHEATAFESFALSSERFGLVVECHARHPWANDLSAADEAYMHDVVRQLADTCFRDGTCGGQRVGEIDGRWGRALLAFPISRGVVSGCLVVVGEYSSSDHAIAETVRLREWLISEGYDVAEMP